MERMKFSCKRKGVDCVALDVCGKEADTYIVTQESLKREYARVSDEMQILPEATPVFDPVVAGHVSVTYKITDKNGAGACAIGEVVNGSVTDAESIALSKAFLSYLIPTSENGLCSVKTDCELSQDKRIRVDYENDHFVVAGGSVKKGYEPPHKPVEETKQTVEEGNNDIARDLRQNPAMTEATQSNPASQKNEHLETVEIKFGPYRTCTIGHVFSEAMKKDANAVSYIEFVLNKQPGTAAFALLQKQFAAYAQEVHYAV